MKEKLRDLKEKLIDFGYEITDECMIWPTISLLISIASFVIALICYLN